MKLLFLNLLLVLFSNQLIGQSPVFKEMKNNSAYPFLLYLPDNLPLNEKPPIIVFLHGRSLSGTDLNMVKRYGVLDALKRGKKIPAIVIAPQVKKSESWNPDKVLQVLEYVQSNYESDTTRVYVVGMSLGGYGTLHFAGKYPEKIAAAVAMCGGGNLKDACNIGQTNVWIQHGKRDRAVPFTQSLEMYDAISSCKPTGECILTLYPKYGHSELAHEFYKDTLYDWLFQFKLGQRSKSIETKSPVIEVIGEEIASESDVREIPEIVNAKSEKNTSTTSNSVHVVKRGDTLSSIAKKNKTTVAKLCKLNGIKETSTLQIGQKIKLK